MSELIRISIDRSNFMPDGSYALFDGTSFKFKNVSHQKVEKIAVSEIEDVNRPGKAKSISTNTNANVFRPGAEFAILGDILGLFKKSPTKKSKLNVKFKDGRYFSGKADTSLVFKLNHILIDLKENELADRKTIHAD